MRDGFVRVAAGTPNLRVGDTAGNAREVIRLMREASAQGCKLLVLPELCLTGYTCGDLFFQRTLIDGALLALGQVRDASEGLDLLTIVGLPVLHEGGLYDCAAVLKDGALLGIVPKIHPDKADARWFRSGTDRQEAGIWFGKMVPFGGGLVFSCEDMPEFSVGVSIGSDSYRMAASSVVACPCAEPEIVGSYEHQRSRMQYQSFQHTACYVVASAGPGESSTDFVFAGRNQILENGRPLAESNAYSAGLTVAELDLSFIQSRRARVQSDHTFDEEPVYFPVNVQPLTLTRTFEKLPFVPSDETLRAERCEQILNIQAQGLAARMRHIGCKAALLGVSGGLDSTLAMLVIARALGLLELPMSSLIAVTMPCFGTTDRTKGNAYKLSEALGCELREINITASVTQHFIDIGHDMNTHDAAYENAQARERTQILMDMANQTNGLVVGTGDMSELALGWATYNGDHMSMYGVNAGVPKTLVRHLVSYAADRAGEGPLGQVLRDIVNTPVSPELLPPVDGAISQKTEELVGPYELHDFFLYHMLRRMAEPRKIKRLAVQSFLVEYDEATIDKWLGTFLRRFFNQQFKRSCAPDAPKIGSVGLSPRGDFTMPSDAVAAIWQENLHS